MSRLSLGCFLLLAALMLLASPAAAHADLVDSSSSTCSVVESGDELRLAFTEELASTSSLTVTADGREVARAGVDLDKLDRREMAVVVPAGVAGQIDVQWVATSAIDDDRTSGRFPLVTDPSLQPECETAEPDDGSLGMPVILGGSLALVVALVATARRSPAKVG